MRVTTARTDDGTIGLVNDVALGPSGSVMLCVRVASCTGLAAME